MFIGEKTQRLAQAVAALDDACCYQAMDNAAWDILNQARHDAVKELMVNQGCDITLSGHVQAWVSAARFFERSL